MRMTFTHPRNLALREIHRILRCPVEFAQTTDSWVLPQSVMELPITSGDSHLLHILEAHADDLLSERRTATGLRGLVEIQLLSMLPSGKVQTAVVAQQLGMSARSFTPWPRWPLVSRSAYWGSAVFWMSCMSQPFSCSVATRRN
jgi:hypothetical protein